MKTANKKYSCKACQSAPLSGGWKRSYKWKTNHGFDNHNCYADTLKREEAQRQKEALRLALWLEWLDLGLTDKQIGDKVFYVSHTVTHPTHEQRGNRMVKVRYEEKRRYFPVWGLITGFAQFGSFDEGKLREAIKNKTDYPHMFIVSGKDKVSLCFVGLESAKEKAEHSQRAHDEHLEFSAFVR